MPRNVSALEAIGEELLPDRVVGCQSEKALSYVTRRRYVEMGGDATARPSVVRHRDHCIDPSCVVRCRTKGLREAMTAADGDDRRSVYVELEFGEHRAGFCGKTLHQDGRSLWWTVVSTPDSTR